MTRFGAKIPVEGDAARKQARWDLARSLPLNGWYVLSNRFLGVVLLLCAWGCLTYTSNVEEPGRLWADEAWCEERDDRPCVEQSRGTLEWSRHDRGGGDVWSFAPDSPDAPYESLTLRHAGAGAVDTAGPVVLVTFDGEPVGVVDASGKRWKDTWFDDPQGHLGRQAAVWCVVMGVALLGLAQLYRRLAARRPGIRWASGEVQVARVVVMVWAVALVPMALCGGLGLPGSVSWPAFGLGALPFLLALGRVALPGTRRAFVADRQRLVDLPSPPTWQDTWWGHALRGRGVDRGSVVTPPPAPPS